SVARLFHTAAGKRDILEGRRDTNTWDGPRDRISFLLLSQSSTRDDRIIPIGSLWSRAVEGTEVQKSRSVFLDTHLWDLKIPDPTGLQVLKKCRVSGRRHFCHPTSFQGRGCENGRSTEDPASGSCTKNSLHASAARGQ